MGVRGITALTEQAPADEAWDAFEDDSRAAHEGTSSRHFLRWLLVLVVLGLVVRLVAALVIGDQIPAEHGDARYYKLEAQAISEGALFVEPFRYERYAAEVPDASHPPLFSAVLAVPVALGVDTWLGLQLVCVAIGTASIVVIALFGRRLAGPSVGLIAAGLATLYPAVWAHEALVLAEVLVVLLVPAVLLGAYRYVDRPSVGRAVVLGATVALLSLTRSEFLFLAPVLIVPLVWRRTTGEERWRSLASAAVVGMLLVGPWVTWNVTRFDDPVLMSHQMGQTLAAANCRTTYEDRSQLGYIDYRCIIATPTYDRASAGAYDPTGLEELNQEAAIEYGREHADRLPVVVLARVGRAWEVYDPSHQVSLHEFIQNRPHAVAWATVWFLHPLVALAVIGLLVLRRSGRVVWPMVVFFGITTVTAAITFGSVRYRAGSDVVVIVLAAVALDSIWQWWRERRATRRDPSVQVVPEPAG
jgi:4-amino-4-deoxy-L-arabinose transferase-like glycosyltransferase